jgi:hypothetical protein
VRGERADDRQHAGRLGAGVDAIGAGAGRLAADVDEPRALAVHEDAVRDGSVEIGVPPTVGERVRRDVEDADDDGLRRPQEISHGRDVTGMETSARPTPVLSYTCSNLASPATPPPAAPFFITC